MHCLEIISSHVRGSFISRRTRLLGYPSRWPGLAGSDNDSDEPTQTTPPQPACFWYQLARSACGCAVPGGLPAAQAAALPPAPAVVCMNV